MKRAKVTMDIETLKTVTGYSHWIPITKGLHEEYFAENFPGWQWNDFVPRLLKEKILQHKGDGSQKLTSLMQGLCISSNIKAIEFTPDRNSAKIRVIVKGEKL